MVDPVKPNIQVKNVYQKLSFVRAELVKRQIKKSGSNTYSHFVYYELGDFLPHINELNNEIGLMTKFNINPKNGETPEEAVLEIINTDKPEEKVFFSSLTENVQIGVNSQGKGGADPIQNLGGKITYMRRYLMMTAYEIGEADSVDAKTNKAPNENEASIDPKDIKIIMETKNMGELFKICHDLRKRVDAKYHKSIMTYYTKRKEELS
jgi:hypothetical protein